tara:strand:+ start:605 stop:892 length:288 start_codon:yes stop_codon:yes gene_type:complete
MEKMKVKEQDISITINQESYFSSLAKDLTSLGSLGFLFWFNYNFIGGSYLVNFLILCMIFLYICKIHKSGIKEADWYFNVSKDKLDKIKHILESE